MTPHTRDTGSHRTTANKLTRYTADDCKDPGLSIPGAQKPEYIRPEVMAFAKAMEDTLRKYDGKKTHWRDVSVSFGYLFGRISDEIREAKNEYHVPRPDYHKCVMELVDVANFCMVCYDKIHTADTRTRPHPPAPEQPRPIGTCPEGAVIGEKILCRSLTFCEFQRIVDHQAMAFCFKEDAALHDIAQAEEAGRLK
jgi:hypothetical protein